MIHLGTNIYDKTKNLLRTKNAEDEEAGERRLEGKNDAVVTWEGEENGNSFA